MTVGRRIALAFSIVLVSCGALSGFLYQTTQKLIADNQWVVHTHAVMELLETVMRSTNRAEAGVLSFVVTGDRSLASAFTEAETTANSAIHQLDKLTRDNADQQLRTAELRRQHEITSVALTSLVSERQPNIEHAKRSISSDAYRSAISQVRSIVFEMKQTEQVLLERRGQSARAAAESSLLVIAGGGLTIIALCALAGLALTLSIVRPVRSLLAGAAEIGAGNLQFRAAVSTSDELGSLAQAFNAMAENLGKTMTTVDTERTARASIERLLKTISETASHLSSSTADIVAATNQQAEGAHQQVASVTETVAAVGEVVQASQQARVRAQQVAEIAQASAEHSRVGRHVVQQSLVAMENIRNLFGRSAETTQSLARTAQAIGEVIESASDIAEQTHVLALNAALEATRAGTQGSTFRIVAAGVKQLAAESKGAAQRVRSMLGDVQAASDSLVVSSQECKQSMGEAAAVVARADASISALANVIEVASQNAAQIAASANQQATGTVQIHRAMEHIREVTLQNLGATRQAERVANDLSALGSRLREDLVVKGKAS